MKFVTIICRVLFLLMFGILIPSCSQQLTQDELENYLQNQENGAKKCFESGAFKATVIYRPTDLLVNQELNSGEKNIEMLKNKYEKYSYFVLNLQNNDADLLNSTASDKAMFAGINEQLSFRLNEHIYIVDSNSDTTYLADFAFPRLYEASKSTSVLLAFIANDIKTDEFKIQIKDIGYTTGSIEFQYDKKDFENIPSLKL